ncbi:YdbL family protein [Luteibacter jiangsuensis]|uniref:YdbL family protein n=1 Tax=Luteibacter jiangsuensis TaxID=637577 RepID=A0ABX0PZ09_9GAMM|nr:YdbL family protein [Luteibacter jiangsuensis]NID03580.1 YdbL family protein [Luteibacter jiangsuensis]
MRNLLISIATLAALVGCVTINVYFPEAAAQKAADQFIGNVLEGSGAGKPATGSDTKPASPPAKQPSASLLDLVIPAAHAAETPDIRVSTPETEAIRARMTARFGGQLKALFASGAVGFTSDGLVAVRDASALPLDQRAQANNLLRDENNDRDALYRAVAVANGHPEWEPQIRKTFAQGWVQRAPSGWYYQDASGAWKRK